MTSIGFVGLGSMGGAIAERLLPHCDLRVYDTSRKAVEKFVAAGAAAAGDARTLGRTCSVLMTCLPTSEIVEEVLLGPGGAAAEMSAGTTVIDMTSGSPQLSRRIAAALRDGGIGYLDAPVSGGPQAAAAGTLAIMVGGPSSTYESCRPLLELISSRITWVGEVGTGHTIKIVNNLLAAGNRLLAFEAAALASRNGVPLDVMTKVVNASSGRSHATEVTLTRHVQTGVLQQNFLLAHMNKDLRLALELAAESDGQLLLGQHVAALYRLFAVLHPDPAHDVNDILRLFERLFDTTVAGEVHDG